MDSEKHLTCFIQEVHIWYFFQKRHSFKSALVILKAFSNKMLDSDDCPRRYRVLKSWMYMYLHCSDISKGIVNYLHCSDIFRREHSNPTTYLNGIVNGNVLGLKSSVNS